jgi:hypothetical protein
MKQLELPAPQMKEAVKDLLPSVEIESGRPPCIL